MKHYLSRTATMGIRKKSGKESSRWIPNESREERAISCTETYEEEVRKL